MADPKTKKGYYKKDEWLYPSVTKIIDDCTDKSAPLMGWATGEMGKWIRKNCEFIEDDNMDFFNVSEDDLGSARFAYKDVSQEALDVGSEVHHAIEKYLGGILEKTRGPEYADDIIDGLSGQSANAFGAFLQWADEHNLKPIALEQTVYGDGWGGTLDFTGYFDGKLYVIDWKSSKAHYPEMRYQVAAYRWATTEKNAGSIVGGNRPYPSQEVQGCGVLRLDKETGLPDWKDTSKSYEQDLKTFNAMVELFFARHPRIKKGAGL